MERFRDRREAGRELARRLLPYRDLDPVVLALPRGGVPVGYEVARALGAPLDIVVVRKLGAPGQPELAIGALVDGDDPQGVLNPDVVELLGVPAEYVRDEVARQLAEIRRREARYRGGRPRVPVGGRTAIVVDDGVATGATVRAALRGLRRAAPRRLVLALPVAPPDTARQLRAEVDDLICLRTPEPFIAVGRHYEDFSQPSDEEVVALLEEARRAAGAGAAEAAGPSADDS
ncbi:MAG TPA: phosphoribosyltransferase [Thermodesulfobacteriota bacterium]|nr:phosphoribosyltransferase [Thermodesulfobacteriota bacterium]